MIVDSSALLAIIFKEPGFESLIGQLEDADAVAAGASTLAETGIVLHALNNGFVFILEYVRFVD